MAESVIRQLARPAPPQVREQQLLGAVLDLGRAAHLFELAGDLELHEVRTAQAWRIARSLAASGKHVTPETVHSAGKTWGLFCEADGAWLLQLSSANALTVETFGQIAADLHRSNLGVGVAQRLEEIARSLRVGNYHAPTTSAELMDASNFIARMDVRHEKASADVLEQAEVWDRNEKTRKPPGLPTGIKLIDEATRPANGVGGMPPKACVMYGAPGTGKNMVLAAMMLWQLESDPDLHLGAFFCEDGSKWLLKRWTALRLGIPLGNVGVVQRTAEQMDRLVELNEHFFKLLDRVHCYRYRRIRPHDMLHQARGWFHQYGIRGVVFDNLRHFDFGPQPFANQNSQQNRRQWADKKNEQMGDAFDSLAEFADRREIPFLALAHTVRLDEKGEHRPPRLSEIADSAGIERATRWALGLWRTKSGELRGTITKNTEGPGAHPATTVEFERLTEAAMIDPLAGRLVNIEQEQREEREARAAEKALASVQAGMQRKKLIAAAVAKEEAEAKKNAPPPPQLALLDVPEAQKP